MTPSCPSLLDMVLVSPTLDAYRQLDNLPQLIPPDLVDRVRAPTLLWAIRMGHQQRLLDFNEQLDAELRQNRDMLEVLVPYLLHALTFKQAGSVQFLKEKCLGLTRGSSGLTVTARFGSRSLVQTLKDMWLRLWPQLQTGPSSNIIMAITSRLVPDTYTEAVINSLLDRDISLADVVAVKEHLTHNNIVTLYKCCPQYFQHILPAHGLSLLLSYDVRQNMPCLKWLLQWYYPAPTTSADIKRVAIYFSQSTYADALNMTLDHIQSVAPVEVYQEVLLECLTDRYVLSGHVTNRRRLYDCIRRRHTEFTPELQGHLDNLLFVLEASGTATSGITPISDTTSSTTSSASNTNDLSVPSPLTINL